jgi:carbon storage regulator
MLDMSRQTNQSVKIGDDIIVTVTQVRGGRVRLGVTAPREIAVDREEVYEAKRAEKARESEAATHG